MHVVRIDASVLCLREGGRPRRHALALRGSRPSGRRSGWQAHRGGDHQHFAPSERKNLTMSNSHPNGDHHGRAATTVPERMNPADVFTEAQALRALLSEASGRTARLLAALKHQRRQNRAVRQAMQSLRQLELDF
jgi:hypothetical protein